MKRTVLALFLILAILSFSACKKENRPVSGEKPVVDVSGESGIRVGVIFSDGEDSEDAYVRSHFQGIEAMRKSLGLSEEQIDRRTDVPVDNNGRIREAVAACVESGCRVIFGTHREYAPIMAEFADKNPDIVFCNALSNRNNENNMSGYVVRMYQTQYLSGVVAGYNTDANVIGFVGYEGEERDLAEINAFAMGVERVNPDAVVYLRKVAKRFDVEDEAKTARSLIEAGCDVIAQNTYSSAPQREAASAGVQCCGYVTDMNDEAPKSCLQGPVINWGLYYTATVKDIIEENWINENFVGGMSDGLADLSPVNHNCNRGTTAAVKEARNDILAGNDVFTGPLFSNRGELVCPEGETFGEDGKFAGMDWHYRNIVELDELEEPID